MAELTPGMAANAFSTRPTQDAQLMPSMERLIARVSPWSGSPWPEVAGIEVIDASLRDVVSWDLMPGPYFEASHHGNVKKNHSRSAYDILCQRPGAPRR
jgi:hypothetical protein